MLSSRRTTWQGRIRKVGLILAGWTLLLGLWGAAPPRALAHVGVEPRESAAGARVTYRVVVPNERDVPTVALELEIPTSLTVVRFQSKPGWERQVEKDPRTGLIRRVVWLGGAIRPEEYDEFVFTALNPSEPGVLVWRAVQVYASGERVEWVLPPEKASHGHGHGHNQGPGPAAVTRVLPAS